MTLHEAAAKLVSQLETSTYPHHRARVAGNVDRVVCSKDVFEALKAALLQEPCDVAALRRELQELKTEVMKITTPATLEFLKTVQR